MIGRLILAIAILSCLGGCAGLHQTPPEFNVKVAANVLAAPDSVDLAKSVAELLPSALQQVGDKLGYTPRRFTVLVCKTSCFANHVPVTGAAAAQMKDRVFLNADQALATNLQAVLAHELTHVLIEEQRGKDLRQVHEWANEGIAVWVSGVGTEGCPGASERLRRHPVCMARTASHWLDDLATSDPHAQRCWLDRMVTGKQGDGCPEPGTMYPQF